MKKRKFLLPLALGCALCGVFALTACNFTQPEGGHEHEHDYRWVDNGDGTHKQHCANNGCDAPDVNRGEHVWNAEGKCENCNAEKPVAAHEHDYRWVDNGDGTHKQHCMNDGCDAPDVNGGEHVWNAEGKCERCDAIYEEPVPEGQLLTFALNESGDGYTVTGIEKDSVTDIVIPFEYEGKPVTAIGESAFDTDGGNPDAVEITSVRIPSSVTEIGDYAFYGLKQLTSIVIPETVTVLGKQILQDSGVTTAEFRCAEVPYAVFWKSTALKKVILGDGVKKIGAHAFRESTLQEINMPEGLDTVGDFAFYYSEQLESIDLSHVKTIGKQAFGYCGMGGDLDLSAIETMGQSTFYYSKNIEGVTLGDNITAIPSAAFSGCYISSLELGRNVKTIDSTAFYYGKFENLVIPDSVTDIDSSAFGGCSNLLTVTYGANMQSDDAIRKSGAYIVEIYNRSSIDVTVEHLVANITSAQQKGKLLTTSDGFLFYVNNALGVNVLVRYTGDPETFVSLPSAAPNGGTYEIGRRAFYDSKGPNVATLVIPDKVTRIRESAFCRNSSLKALVIGSGLQQIDASAFGTTPNITKLYYNGTKEGWNAVAGIDQYNMFQAKPKNVTYFYYSATTPSDQTEQYWHWVNGNVTEW